MRKLPPILLLAILVLALALPVRADSAATGLDVTAAVSTDGSVSVTVLLTAHLDLPDSDLAFPVPAGAKNVTLNGNSVKASHSGDTQLVSLAGLTGDSGDFSVTIGYTLPSQVAYRSDGKAQLTLPLLSGFHLPIQSGTFRVSLPSAFTAKPVFSSGYYQTGIDGSLKISSAVGSVTATITGTLRDRETLTMTVEAPTELYPEVDPTAVHPEKIFSPMLLICAGLALLYYIFFLRFPLLFPETTADPPEGITAGELPTALTCRGADLTLMVLSWAQLGYILIYLEEDGRVTLHKRMGMGNERSSFEQKCFRRLFADRTMVNATGKNYAMLADQVSRMGHYRGWVDRRSGRKDVVQFLGRLMGLAGGVLIGCGLVKHGVPAILTGILFGILGMWSAGKIQVAGILLLRPNRRLALETLGHCAVWVLLGLPSGQLSTAVLLVLGELLLGTGAAFGGRRTRSGKMAAAQALGLRKYLKTINRGELQRLSRRNPNFFFDLYPYAIALGVDRAFARQFGAMRLPGCPYLTTGMDGHMTAGEWGRWISETAEDMDRRKERLKSGRLRAALNALTAPAEPRRKPKDRRKRR